ncbi:hypothetical protein VP01_2556g6 [Puccinia sorghi]|uniref:Major facilitator superfamily (MFS) profile domain-containing protein n=1 Tax=Puccinia sorghi TaxID=27349 RepID=A0A0L6V560_9BASI|nr:hypothetical protein VP01_2556g6 [Puccinia sorghi]
MKNYASLIVIRLLLGLFEGGLLPVRVVLCVYVCVDAPRPYELSLFSIMWYAVSRECNELQLRVGVFFASASLSGAFGGLLAYGIEMMEGVAGKQVARLRFVPKLSSTSGLATKREKDSVSSSQQLAAAGAATLDDKIPAIPLDPTRLEEEKSLTFLHNHDGIIGMAKTPEGAPTSSEEKFEKFEVIRALKEPQVWLTGIGYMSLCLRLMALLSYYSRPSIVEGMGYHGTQAQLYSSFPYLPASVLVVVIAFMADKLQMRGPMVMMLLPLTIVGYAMALAAKTNALRYLSVFFMAAGIYPSVPSILCILPNNTAGLTKRSVTTALQLMIANCAGFIATFIYTSDQATSNYKKGHSIALAFTCLAWLMIGLNSCYCAWENKARSQGRRASNVDKYQALIRSGKTSASIGDRAPDFKLTV